MMPQYGPGIDAEVAKLRRDVPVTDAAGVNAYSRTIGVDRVELVIEAGGVMVGAGDSQAAGAAAPLVSAASVQLAGAVVIASTAAGVWTAAPASTAITVELAGANINGACTFSLRQGPGVVASVTAAGVVSLVSITNPQSSGYTDVIITGPFAGAIVRRITWTKDYAH